jgi:hypothetical protein
MDYLRFSSLGIILFLLQETLMPGVIQLKFPHFVVLCLFTIGKHELKIIRYLFKKELILKISSYKFVNFSICDFAVLLSVVGLHIISYHIYFVPEIYIWWYRIEI